MQQDFEHNEYSEEYVQGGWEQMKGMLDEHDRRHPKGFFLKRALWMSLLVFTFLAAGVYILTDKKEKVAVVQDGSAMKPVFRELPAASVSQTGAKTLSATVTPAESTASPRPQQQETIIMTRHPIRSSRDKKQETVPLVLPYRKPLSTRRADVSNREHVQPEAYIALSSADMPEYSGKRFKALRKPYEPHLLVGLSANFSGQSAFSLQHIGVYPSVTVQLPLTKKVFGQAGLGILSPVSHQKEDAPIKEFVNNAVDNIHYQVYTTNLIRSVYVDLPVTINYQFTPTIFAGAGLEISRLVKSKVSEKKETYGFSNELTRFEQNTFVTSAPSFGAFPSQVQVKNWDSRAILQAGWQKNRISASLVYRQGLGASVQLLQNDGSLKHLSNSFFSVNLQWQLFPAAK